MREVCGCRLHGHEFEEKASGASSRSQSFKGGPPPTPHPGLSLLLQPLGGVWSEWRKPFESRMGIEKKYRFWGRTSGNEKKRSAVLQLLLCKESRDLHNAALFWIDSAPRSGSALVRSPPHRGGPPPLHGAATPGPGLTHPFNYRYRLIFTFLGPFAIDTFWNVRVEEFRFLENPPPS